MSNLVMVISKTGMKFVGKHVEQRSDVNFMTLDDAILVSEFMTNNGLAIAGSILGNMTFPANDCIHGLLDSKSPYYQNYFQTTSNIAISKDTKIPFKN